MRSLEELEASGLKLADFDPSDATPDKLMSMQSARTSLDDARSLGEELRVALSRAEEGMAVKSRFLAVMSHEIRTPLNAVIGLTEVVLRTELDPAQRDNLRTVIDSAESLLSVINDILDFSKIEANKLELESIEFELNGVLTAATESLASQAETKAVELLVDTSKLHTNTAVSYTHLTLPTK